MKKAIKNSARVPRVPGAPGFTLVELMIVVAILGILSAVAIPSFRRYIIRSKTVEAFLNLEHITQSARAYFVSEHAASDGSILAKQFPTSSIPPNDLCASAAVGFKCPGETNGELSFEADQSWQALNFNVVDPHYFTYDWYAGPAAAAKASVLLSSGVTYAANPEGYAFPSDSSDGVAFAESEVDGTLDTYFSYYAWIRQDPDGEVTISPVSDALPGAMAVAK